MKNTTKHLICELLTIDVQKRPSIDQLIEHKWFDRNVIELAHKIMDLPLLPVERTNDVDIFLRPYDVKVDSEDVQSAKRRRLR